MNASDIREAIANEIETGEIDCKVLTRNDISHWVGCFADGLDAESQDALTDSILADLKAI